MLPILMTTLALAAPPSSQLSGANGTLYWSITDQGDTIRMEGASPKWHVVHDASADLTPIHTERTDPDGTVTTIDYTSAGATWSRGGKTVQVSQANLWDGDTLDVRLGYLVANGKTSTRFAGIDSASGKVYTFDAQSQGATTCGARSCTHLLVQLTGVLRWVGPSWNYWFADDGQLLRFEGPAGSFVAADGS